MRQIFIKPLLLICFLNLSCSSNDDITKDSIKENRRLENIIFTNVESQNSERRSLTYDEKNNLIETRGEKNRLISKNTYDEANRLLTHEFNEYNNDELFFKEIDIISYDNQNRIINIEHKSSFHSTDTGIREIKPSNHKISYADNKIIKTFDGGSTNKVEYLVEDKLVKEVKLYTNNKLAGDFKFKFDSKGNCISGSGPILIGLKSEITNNIDLKVTYGSEKNIKQFRRPFLDYDLLSLESFYSLRQIMTNQIGTNLPEKVSWSISNNTIRILKNDYTLDNEGFITQNTESELPDYPNHTKIEYIWK